VLDQIPYEYQAMMAYQIVIVWPLWRIYRRAGLNPWLSLLVLLPLAGSLLVLVPLGIVKWPNLPLPAPKPRKKRMV